MSKELEQILQRLDQLLPPAAPATDWKASIAFRWRSAGRRGSGYLQPVRHVHRIKLSDLHGIDRQIDRVEQNTRQFIDGKPANNVLLTGARGTGKSSIVKGLLNKFAKQQGRVNKGFTDDAHEAIETYARPGNVREMENKIKAAAFVLCALFFVLC